MFVSPLSLLPANELTRTCMQLRDLPQAERHVFNFNKTLLLLGSCKLRIEETYTQILERACIPKAESLMKRDASWEDLQVQAKLRAYLKDDLVGFKKTINALEQNLGYFKRKLSIKDNFLVRDHRRGCTCPRILTAALEQAEMEHDWDQETLIHKFLAKWVVVQNGCDASKYERLVRKIGEGVERLFTFAPSTDGEPQEASNTDLIGPTEFATSYLHIRDHTQNLWDKLSHIWLYNCPVNQHSASISLCPAGVPIGNHEQVRFSYSFLLHNQNEAGASWRDVVVMSQ